MSKPKKHPKDWTTEEAMKKLFPKKVREEVEKVVERPMKSSINKKSK